MCKGNQPGSLWAVKQHLRDKFGEHRCSKEKALNQHHFRHPSAVSDHFSGAPKEDIVQDHLT